ncbi:hypothetical protein [Coleofasciculus sp. H7-2]|uniref:hypothetical protein n=1 Tax=Coleofasciculus sp. H7-2 TaxID=3351545 RepID=UPI0036720914
MGYILAGFPNCHRHLRLKLQILPEKVLGIGESLKCQWSVAKERNNQQLTSRLARSG